MIAYLQILFYLLFVLLWFQESLPEFQNLQVNPLFALVPFISLTVLRLFLRRKNKPHSVSRSAPPEIVFPAILVVLATAIRIPFLVHHFGLFTSDDAIPALMAMHIAEGQTPPLFYFGQIYLGSLPSHIMAAAVHVFGYSPLLVKMTAFVFYLAFIIVHYRLLSKMFSKDFARTVSLFYCLPLPELIILSLDNTSHFALALFLGTLMISIAVDISARGRLSSVSWLGFLMGLAFWTHEITTIFILASAVVVFKTLRLQPKKILNLAGFAVIGAFPLVLHNLFGLEKFTTIKFLLSGGFQDFSAERYASSGILLHHLLGTEVGVITWILLSAALAGFVGLSLTSLRTRTDSPRFVYPAFFLIFTSIYMLSSFGAVPVIRYLYPLFFCLPVFIFAAVRTEKRNTATCTAGILILLVIFASSVPAAVNRHQAVKERSLYWKSALDLLRKTGEPYWLGEYWTAYVVTALSGRDIIVNSYSIQRYPPHRLLYENRTDRNHFIFVTSGIDGIIAESLVEALDTFGIAYQTAEVRDILLVYDIQSPVSPHGLGEKAPDPVPRLELTDMRPDGGYFNLTFTNSERRLDRMFRLRVEIPEFSTAAKTFQGTDADVSIRIPFPEGHFTIRQHVEFNGFVIRKSVRETPAAAPDAEKAPRRSGIVFLSGFSGPVNVFDKRMRICEKTAVLEIHDVSGQSTRLRLHLHSPFNFSHWSWYGNFVQTAVLRVNGGFPREVPLRDGSNIIEFDFDVPSFRPGRNLVELDFTYHGFFDFAGFWKTAALLEHAEILN